MHPKDTKWRCTCTVCGLLPLIRSQNEVTKWGQAEILEDMQRRTNSFKAPADRERLKTIGTDLWSIKGRQSSHDPFRSILTGAIAYSSSTQRPIPATASPTKSIQLQSRQQAAQDSHWKNLRKRSPNGNISPLAHLNERTQNLIIEEDNPRPQPSITRAPHVAMLS